jgi:hypothetical protein
MSGNLSMLSLVSWCSFLVESLTHLVCAMIAKAIKTEEVYIRRNHSHLLINIEIDNLADYLIMTPLLRIPYLIHLLYGLVHDRAITFAGKVHF